MEAWHLRACSFIPITPSWAHASSCVRSTPNIVCSSTPWLLSQTVIERMRFINDSLSHTPIVRYCPPRLHQKRRTMGFDLECHSSYVHRRPPQA
ncbi:hypothetical protein EI94DRAFT_929068 [Lactarius quietus]|nr:hypothetical protein EI94DRAFT_929068 [Lactarius quietus]